MATVSNPMPCPCVFNNMSGEMPDENQEEREYNED